MKTITEYSPLIFSKLTLAAERRLARRRQLGLNAWMVAGYSTVGALLCFDLGRLPWEWQFWMVFGPLFVVGELALGKWEEYRQREAERAARPRVSQAPDERRIKIAEIERHEGSLVVTSAPFWMAYQRSEFSRSLQSETAV